MPLPYMMGNEENNKKNTRLSYGISCCFYDNKTHKWKVLLAKKRYSHCFVAFVFGQYTKKDDRRLQHLFNNMTKQEKIEILSMRFDILWYKIWLELPDVSNKQKKDFDLSSAESVIDMWNSMYKQKTSNTFIPYDVNASKLDFYIKRKTKFESTFVCDNGQRLRELIKGTRNIELFWEIPKGRRQKKETMIDCAIREFAEETGFGVSKYTLMFDSDPIRETFTSMGIQYIHTYYLAFAHGDIKPDNIFRNVPNMSEIDRVKWVDLDELKYLNHDGRLQKTVSKAINIMKSRHIHKSTEIS